MLTTKIKFYTACLCFLYAQVGYADDAPESIFIVSDSPPPGFEFLDAPETTQIDLYYGDTLIGPLMATFTDSNIEFIDPEQVAQLIDTLPLITDRAIIIQALSGQLPTNSSQLCRYQTTNVCGVLSPGIASILFDRISYRADLFINASYLATVDKKVTLLPPSSAGFSLVSHFNGLGSGNRERQNYSLRNETLIGQSESFLNMRSNYSKTTQEDQTDSLTHYQIETLNLNMYRGNYTGIVGLMNAKGTLFIPQQNIIGFSLSNQSETILNKDALAGTQLDVFLQYPSQVRIFKDNVLIASQSFTSGRHLINTSSFPSGAYNLRLEIQDSLGNTTEEERFFYKSLSIPPLDYPYYYVSLGILGDDNNNQGLFPNYSTTPLLQVRQRRSWTNNWGNDNALVTTDRDSFVSSGIFYFNPYWQLELAGLAATRKRFATNISNQLKFGNLTGTANLRRFWGLQQTTNTANTQSNNLLKQSPLQVNTSLNYYWESLDLRLQAGASFTRSLNRSLTRQYSYSLQRPIIRSGSFSSTVSLRSVHTQNDTTIFLTLSFNFNKGNWSSNGSVGYRANNGDERSGYEGRVSGQWRKHWDNRRHLQLGANLQRTTSTESAGVRSTYQTIYYRFNGDYNYNNPRDSESNSQFSVSLDSSLVYTDNKLSFNHATNRDAGVLIYVKGPIEGETVNVVVNNTSIAKIPVNQSATLFLSPFKTYSVQIQPQSNTLYHYQGAQRITLYRGNVANLNWELTKETIIFTRIVDQNNNPIAYATIEGDIGINETDADGYLQAEITSATSLVAKTPDGETCHITLPEIDRSKTFVNLGTLVCE